MTTEVEDSIPLSHPSTLLCNYKTSGQSCTQAITYIATLQYCWCDEHPGFSADECPDGASDPRDVGVCIDHAIRLRIGDWVSLIGMRSA